MLPVTYVKDGEEHVMEGDYIISSMPVKDLVAGMNDVPADPARIAAGLPYRDYMTLGVLVPKINLKNKTNLKTVGNIVHTHTHTHTHTCVFVQFIYLFIFITFFIHISNAIPKVPLSCPVPLTTHSCNVQFP